MDALTISAASGLKSRLESLDMLANNLSNANTGGFKTDREFYGLYLAPEAMGQDDDAVNAPGTLPVVQKHWTDFSQGLLQPTGNPLDLAISGKGFFVARAPSGPVYTRNGNFQVSPAGELVTAEGYPVQLQGNAALKVDPAKPLLIATDGSVAQGDKALGTLQVVSFADPSALAKMGRNYFQSADTKVQTVAAKSAEVYQGKIEASNVGVAESAVHLVGIMRQFEMLQKAISLGSDMNRGVDEVAKINS